jgi:ADP-ribosylglycohydrolase
MSLLFEKVYGCLLGGVIGDAMGAPAEDMTYDQVKEKFGWINDFEGAGTDDSAIKLILCEAIIKSGGRVTADEFADAFLANKEKYYNLFYIPVRNMFHKIESKLCLPVYAGIGNMHSSSSAMAISPMGIINAGNPRRAAIETYDVAGLIHAGDSTFCRDGACAMAAAVAQAMDPASTVESVLAASTKYLHKDSSRELLERIRLSLELAGQTKGYEEFREAYYRLYLGDIVSDSRETVPCVLVLFKFAEGDPVKAIEYAANFGRDADTIASMAGALCGAFSGAGALKPEWVEKVERAYGETHSSAIASGQKELANKLIDILTIRTEEERRCLAVADGLIAGS